MFDVVVVGAGLSGLQAAYSAQQAGLSVAVVEARNRVGGKVWSVPLASKRGMADLGAAWVNDTLQRRIWAYVEKFGLHVVKQRLEGKAVMQRENRERIVFPYGITPEVSSMLLRLEHMGYMKVLTQSSLDSSRRRRRRIWSSCVITSKLFQCDRRLPAWRTTRYLWTSMCVTWELCPRHCKWSTCGLA